jgi:hypothetical protein
MRIPFALLIAITTTFPGPASAQVVDSLLPMEEELRRFRADLPAPAALSGGERSRDRLVRRFVTALETRDSAALRAMLITKAEFAHLYFPVSEYTKPPYRQKPSLVWFRMTAVSEQGLSRALARDGGSPLRFQGYRCETTPTRRGPNRLWQGCRLRVGGGGTVRERRLFGTIIERGGHFKFLTYATEY